MAEKRPAARRLVTILGTGPRAPVTYRIDERKTRQETKSLDDALIELEDLNFVTALGTEKAIEVHAKPATIPFRARKVPDGKSVKEFWELFEAVREAVDEACDAAFNGEDGGVVIFNLTHGFRAQQLVALSAVNFTLDNRRRLGKPGEPRLVYGELTGEIWDMTSILAAEAWASALTALTEHARADQFEALLKGLHNSVARAGAKPPPNFKGIGRAARELVDALVTGRTHLLKTTPAEYLSRWEAGRAELVERLPHLKGPLDDFAKQVERLRVNEAIVSPDGIEASLAACEWLGKAQHFSAMTALMRETVVSAHALQRGARDCEPGGDCTGREEIEVQLNRAARAGTALRKPSAWGELTNLRNDVQHAGYNEDPRAPNKVRDHAEAMRHKVANLARHPVFASFVNLTNHASSTWSDEQRARALDLGRTIIDVPFPDVNPSATTSEIAALATTTANEVLRHLPAAVAVQGEHTLCHAVVAELERLGIPCFAATTRRDTEEQVADDVVTRTSRFRFERWRRYFLTGQAPHAPAIDTPHVTPIAQL